MELARVLPLYFKAKSYSSFVRQLNMYSFYKIKGQRNEFRHPLFRRDGVEDLKYIRRKNVRKLNDNNSNKNYGKKLNQNAVDLKLKLSRMEEILGVMDKQNHGLVQINSVILKEMKYIKDDFDYKMKNLSELLTNVISKKDLNLISHYKEFMNELQQNSPHVAKVAFEAILSDSTCLPSTENPSHLNFPVITDKLIEIYHNQNSNKTTNPNTHENSLDISVPRDTQLNEVTSIAPVTTHMITEDLSPINSPYVIIPNYDRQCCDVSPLGFYQQLQTPYSQSSTKELYQTIEDMHFEALVNDSYGDLSLLNKKFDPNAKGLFEV